MNKNCLYKCDNNFHINNFAKLYEENENDAYIAIIISGSGCKFVKIAIINDEIDEDLIYKSKVELQKSQKKGGQSANRIERLHDESHFNYITIILEKLDEIFAQDGQYYYDNSPAKFIIVGPSIKKDELFKRMKPAIKKCVLKIIVNIGDCKDIIIDDLYSSEEKLINNITDPNAENVVYGEKETTMDFAQNLLKYLLIHREIIESKPPEAIKKLKEKCGEKGVKLCIIGKSGLSNEKTEIFLKGYGGFAGIKWY